MHIVKLYQKEVISLAIPIAMSGVIGYINNLATCTLASKHSVELVAGVTLGSLMISTLLSPLMSLIPANQSLMIKIDNYSEAEKSALILSALLHSFLLGIFCFILSNQWIKFISVWLISFNSELVRHLAFFYIEIAKYSLLLVPTVFSLVGIMNGLQQPQLSLRLTLFGSGCKLLILLLSSGFYQTLTTEQWLITLAIANVISEAASLGYGVWLITQQCFLSGNLIKLSLLFTSFIFYCKQIKYFLSYTALQNLLGVCGELLFSGLLANINLAILAIYRLTNQVFTFNRMIFNGLYQANAMVVSKLFFSNKKSFEHYKIKKYISFTLNLSLFFSTILIIITNFLAGQFIGIYILNTTCIISLAFMVEGISLLFFHVLLHCNEEKKIGLTNIILSFIFGISVLLGKITGGDGATLQLFVYKLSSLAMSVYFIYGKGLHKDL